MVLEICLQAVFTFFFLIPWKYLFIYITLILIIFPIYFLNLSYFPQVMKSRSLCFRTRNGLDSLFSEVGEQPYSVKNFLNTMSTSGTCLGIQLKDLYNYFDVKLNDFKVRFLILIFLIWFWCLLSILIFVTLG